MSIHSTYHSIKRYGRIVQLLFTFFLILTLSNPVKAQVTVTPETAFLHMAKTGYVAGEVMWFKVYVISTTGGVLSPVSKIAYLDILNEDLVAVYQQKVEIENGMGDGSWSIPSGLPTGKYSVRAYVAAQKSHPGSIFSYALQVINPALPSPSKILLSDTGNDLVMENFIPPQSASDLGLNVNGLQQKYRKRSKVSFRLTDLPFSAQLSIAVFKKDGLELNNQQSLDLTSSIVKQSATSLLSDKNLSVVSPVEYNGHFVTGNVVDKLSGKPIRGVEVYLSVSGERFYFGKATSDEKGGILFDVGKPYGSQQVVVQLPFIKDSNAVVQINSPYAVATTLEKFDGTVLYQGPKNQLDDRVFYSTIDKSFEKNRETTYFLPHFNDSTVFYGTPDKTYYLDDYTRFNTMEEVLREYVVEVDLRKSNQQYKFSVLDIPNKKSFENNPLVLVDGVPTSDINKVVAFDPLKIKRMDIVSRKFFLGDQSYDGIVSLITYNGDLAGFDLDRQTLVVDYPGIPMKRQFKHVQYVDDEAVKSRVPDLRVLLYWDPFIKIKKQQTQAINFYTPDLVGNYIIEIRGVTENGKVLTQQHYFSVVN